jgi:hypothetical protein
MVDDLLGAHIERAAALRHRIRREADGQQRAGRGQHTGEKSKVHG